MEILLFIKHLRSKSSNHYQVWMRILIEYSGRENQEIKLSVTPKIAKSSYYRIIDYGLKVFPNFVKSHSLIKKRNSLFVTNNIDNKNEIKEIELEVEKPKTIKKEKSKTIDNTNSIEEIINYLNLITGKAYKLNSKIAISNINARIKEGYSIDDFKKVIEIKCQKWLGTKMEDYLTPNTLFGNKFESYLNEKLVTEKTKQDNNYEQVSKATELGWNT
jgi:uncharacterized phage protein (TIGR02220 family)